MARARTAAKLFTSLGALLALGALGAGLLCAASPPRSPGWTTNTDDLQPLVLSSSGALAEDVGAERDGGTSAPNVNGDNGDGGAPGAAAETAPEDGPEGDGPEGDGGALAPEGDGGALAPEGDGGALAETAAAKAPALLQDWRVLGASRLEGARGKVTRGFLRHRIVHFTFDDGPRLETTPQLLDALAAYHVRATFFVVGKQLGGPRSLERRALLQRIEAEGHTIAVHTNGHSDLSRMSREQIKADLERIERSLASTLGYRPGLFRPPFGRRTGQSVQLLSERGYTQVLWNIPPEEDARTAQEILSNFRRLLDRMDRHPSGPGGIVLLHDPHAESVEAFSLMMDELRQRNCGLLNRDGEDLWDVASDLLPFLLGEERLTPDLLTQRQLDVRRDATSYCAELVTTAQVEE